MFLRYSLFRKKKIVIYLLILAAFSTFINYYYANLGVFPPDSFCHFDNGFRILLGEHPFKDYWVVSGPIIDYLQAIFFYVFGVSWNSYLIHASVFNLILTVATFILLRKFNLSINLSFFYSLLFSILAYTSSGTPFPDHHSAFFSLLGVYSLILAIKSENKIHWFLFPILFAFAFFSKQVPSSYIIIFVLLILFLFSILQKNFSWIKYSATSTISLILIILIFGKTQNINLSSFFEQYIYYPQTIGQSRIENLNLTFNGVIAHFKFIYIVAIPFVYFNLKNIFSRKNYFKEKDFLYFLSFLLLTFSLIFHQLLTKNQTFIFFLIPILAAFSHISLQAKKLKLNRNFSIFLIVICLFSTFKYHLRFNEERKFHELNYVNFNLAIKGEKIDKKLSGIKWISPQYSTNPDKEVNLINDIKNHIIMDKRSKMVMTHYLFFSTILNEKLLQPSRWLLSDGTTHPLKENKYYPNYKNLLLDIIKKNEVKVIYVVDSVAKFNIYHYLDKECYVEKRINEILNIYELKSCKEINDI